MFFEFDTLLINICGYIGALLLLILITKVTGEYITHAHIFSIIWGISILIAQLLSSPIYYPKLSTIILLFITWWIFLIASLLKLIKSSKQNSRDLKYKGIINKGLAILSLIILIGLQALAVIYELYSLGLNTFGGINNIILAYPTLRLDNSLSNVDLPWFFQMWRWGFVWYIPLAMVLLHEKLISKKLLIIILIFSFFSAIIKFTRAPIFQVATIAFISWVFIFKPRNQYKFLLGIGAGIILVVIFIGMQSQLLIYDPNPFGKNLEGALFSYAGAPIIAYQDILDGNWTYEPGFYSFDALNYVLMKLGIIESYPNLIRPTTFVPVPTNLYTFLDAFTLDFGIIGAIFGSALLGLFISSFYIMVKKNPNLFAVSCYSFLVYGCLMVTANNEFIRFSLPWNIFIAYIINALIYRGKQRIAYHTSSRYKA